MVLCFLTSSAVGQFVNVSVDNTLATVDHSTHSKFGFSKTLAPSWELTGFQGESFSSAQLAGRGHLLILFQGHECLHCTQQLVEFGPVIPDFEAAGFEVIAVSTDAEEVLADSIRNFDGLFPFKTLLADPKLSLFKTLGAYAEKRRQALHGIFLIDSQGIIRWQNVSQHPFMDHKYVLSLASNLSSIESRGINPANINADSLQQDQDDEPKIKAPKIFLNRSPKIVAYQLSRLNNTRLLLVERNAEDPKFIPVHKAVLTRAGMSPNFRNEALAALIKLKSTNAVTELVAAISELEITNRQTQQIADELSRMLLDIPSTELSEQTTSLVAGLKSENKTLRAVCHAALISCGAKQESLNFIGSDQQKTIDWLTAVAMIKNSATRSQLREDIEPLLDQSKPNVIRKGAIRALGFAAEGAESQTCQQLSGFLNNDELRLTAVQALLQIPDHYKNNLTASRIVSSLVDYAEQTPAERRTTDHFSEAMQLADRLLKKLAIEDAKNFRTRLNAVSVRVVRILTVEDEMRYDLPYFAVQAGRPVQVLLKNEDLMAHNFVVTKPGKLKEVAALGLAAGPKNGMDGKQYVPSTDDVLFATDMVPAYSQTRLTFTAPSEPGEYPYVCTFPRHWSRMYGIMVVVKDLDDWQQNPTTPKDPIGSNRSFVKKWQVEDLQSQLETGIRGRTMKIGKRIFTEATCVQCHELNGEGGAVGPELNQVMSRHNGSRVELLREILDPSHRIDEKYKMHMILTLDGETISGIVQKQDDETVEIIDNPESKEPRSVAVDDIDEMILTTKSLMPKALMDRFTKDEIMELLAYIESNQSPAKK